MTVRVGITLTVRRHLKPASLRHVDQNKDREKKKETLGGKIKVSRQALNVFFSISSISPTEKNSLWGTADPEQNCLTYTGWESNFRHK